MHSIIRIFQLLYKVSADLYEHFLLLFFIHLEIMISSCFGNNVRPLKQLTNIKYSVSDNKVGHVYLKPI